MNWVDLVWLLAVLAGGVGGLRGGVLSELLRMAGWGVIVWVAVEFATVMQLSTLVGLAFGLLVVAWVIRKLVRLIAGPPGLVSRLVGLVLGAARMVALMILLTLGVARLQSQIGYRPVCVESRCGAAVMLWFHGGPVTDQIQRII